MVNKAHPPELKKYLDKQITVKLNAARIVQGVLRGFDPFMNLVLDDGFELSKDGQRNKIGMIMNYDRRGGAGYSPRGFRGSPMGPPRGSPNFSPSPRFNSGSRGGSPAYFPYGSSPRHRTPPFTPRFSPRFPYRGRSGGGSSGRGYNSSYRDSRNTEVLRRIDHVDAQSYFHPAMLEDPWSAFVTSEKRADVSSEDHGPDAGDVQALEDDTPSRQD
ncbi:unnamed protein product [Notodromas monacha]|uniref:Small nuclear ribonucleoprotein G n=1 Tax=Notodromas monacha TaxID=399045 RepID=A0A7R9BVV3_9CRUS|nr:unnamed protein product [Notodromas monacha]CAG0921535.1 unnamed protein product [Notodromas monacha]